MLSVLDSQEPTYLLTVVAEDGIMRFEQLTSETALVTRLRELMSADEEISVGVFFGFKLNISRPPLRYLVTPWGNIPLFDPLPTALQIEEDGFIGKRYNDLLAPSEAPDDDEVDNRRGRPVTDEDEEEEEEDDAPTVDEDVDIFGQLDEEDEGDDE